MSKILVAEDDVYLANAYRVKLTKAGFDVKIASDGQEALDTLPTFSPNIILLDLVMPRKDGFTALAEIRAKNEWKTLPIIIASNLGQKEDIEKGMRLGATDFIIKSEMPLNDLITKINTLIALDTKT